MKNKVISICLSTVMIFLTAASSLAKAYEITDSNTQSKSYDPFRIIRTLQSDPNFISIEYMDYGAFNEPIESTKRKVNSIEEVVNGPKGLYIIDRGSGWIRENDKDLIGTSGIEGGGTATISKAIDATFGHTITGGIGAGIGLKNIQLGLEFAFRRLFKEGDKINIDYSMQAEPGKNLYLKAYTTNRKTEVYMKPNSLQFSSLDTTYEPDGSWLKPVSFEKGQKLDLDSLVEKKERCILYGNAPNNEENNNPSFLDNAKSKFMVLNKQLEKLFNIAITNQNVVRIVDIKDRQLDPDNPDAEFFKFMVFDKNGNQRISVALNGSDKPSSSKLAMLDKFTLNNDDAIKVSHKYAENASIILESMVHLDHGANIDTQVNHPIFETMIDDFYFIVNKTGLTLESIYPIEDGVESNPVQLAIQKSMKQNNTTEQKPNKDNLDMIFKNSKKDKNSDIYELKDLILNGDYEGITKINLDSSGNPVSSEIINTEAIKEKAFVPPNDGTFVINRGEGWISSEEKNKITTSIVPPGASSSISRSSTVIEEYIIDFNTSASFTKNLVTAVLKIGAGPIMSASNTITVGGSNAINNSKYTYMKAYALNHKLEVINVINGKITDKATMFKGKGHWIVPILFDGDQGLNQKEYFVKDNTKVLNYDDKFDGSQVIDYNTEIIPGNMNVDSYHYRYTTDTVKSNMIAMPFTVQETGTYIIQSKASRYDYPYLPFGAGLGRPSETMHGFNFKTQIFEVEKDNVRKVKSLLYDGKHLNPTVGAQVHVNPNLYGDQVTLRLEAGKTYLYWINTDGLLGHGRYTSSLSGTSYLIKKGLKFFIRRS